jgi:hypothetical protein
MADIIHQNTIGTPIPAGKTRLLVAETNIGPSTHVCTFTIDSDTVLLSLYVSSLTGGGTLDAVLYTETEVGKQVAIITFPQISSPTAELLIRKAAFALGNCRLIITVAGVGATATFELRAKGITSGEASVKILGNTDWGVESTTITTTPSQIIPTSLTDRNGLVIKNNSGVTVYIAESSAKCTTTVGYPLGAGESLAMDLGAGQQVWGRSASGSADIRYAEAGG